MFKRLSGLAGYWCNNSKFIEYLNRHITGEPDVIAKYGKAPGDLEPAVYVREICNIQSRCELDTNPCAARRFLKEIRDPFLQWCRNEEQQ